MKSFALSAVSYTHLDVYKRQQEANVRALSAGTTTDKIFDMVRRIRQKTDIPMVFMTYANVVYSYGSCLLYTSRILLRNNIEKK